MKWHHRGANLEETFPGEDARAFYELGDRLTMHGYWSFFYYIHHYIECPKSVRITACNIILILSQEPTTIMFPNFHPGGMKLQLRYYYYTKSMILDLHHTEADIE